MGRVLHASYSGYFPTCIKNSSELFQEGVFAKYSEYELEIAMRSYWLYKKIKIEGTYEYYDDQQQEIVEKDYKMVIVSDASKEENLVCMPGWTVESATNLIRLDGGPVVGTSQFLQKKQVDFYSANKNIVINYYFIDVYFPYTYGPAGISAYTVLVSNSPIIEFKTFQIGDLVFYGTNAAKTLNAEIIEYWTYDGLYDEKTGKLKE